MSRDVSGSRGVFYALMRDYLNDAKGNLVVAQHHLGSGNWKAAALCCAIGSRLLVDLSQELADDEILLTKQKNSLIREANEVGRKMWLAAQKVRRCGKPCREVSKMLRSFVAYDAAKAKRQAAEA